MKPTQDHITDMPFGGGGVKLVKRRKEESKAKNWGRVTWRVSNTLKLRPTELEGRGNWKINGT